MIEVVVAFLLILIVGGEPKQYPRPLATLDECVATGKAIQKEMKSAAFACFPLKAAHPPLEGHEI